MNEKPNCISSSHLLYPYGYNCVKLRGLKEKVDLVKSHVERVTLEEVEKGIIPTICQTCPILPQVLAYINRLKI